MTKNTCFTCGQSYFEPRVYRRDLPGDHDSAQRYAILACPHCGSGWTDPMPADEDLSRLYAGYGSRPSMPDAPEPTDFLVRWRKAWGHRTARALYDRSGGFRRRVQRRMLSCFLIPRVTLAPLYTDVLRRSDRPKRRLRMLDVGCGSCEVMSFAKSAGVDVVGTEVDESAAARGRALGFDVRAVDITDMVGRESFDIVRFSHVLEHVKDPERDLIAAHQLLGVGGYLMIAVPQIPSAVTLLLGRKAHFHLPFHRHHFTRLGIRGLLRRTGFRTLGRKSKSNSVLAQSLSRWFRDERLSNHLAMRIGCITIEMMVDAVGLGDAMEVHAVVEVE